MPREPAKRTEVRHQGTEALHNILAALQAKPESYKAFGVFWWPVKALLKGAGYGPDELYYLGSYTDPETAKQVPPGNLQETLGAALSEYSWNLTFPHANGQIEAPDGELVTIWDADAGR
jgi:hypothetical protein